MFCSSITISIISLLLLTLFASSATAQGTAAATIPSPTTNTTYTKPDPTNNGNTAATSSLVGAAAIPDAQFSAFFALAVAIFGSLTLGLGF